MVKDSKDALGVLRNSRRQRNYALQQSISTGLPYVFMAAPSVATWVIALEDKRRIHGALIGGEVHISPHEADAPFDYLIAHGMEANATRAFLDRLPTWQRERADEAAAFLKTTFYTVSGWTPELMEENRMKARQQEQLHRAIEDHRNSGKQALYAFEKERMLLACIRAGDRQGARRILNEMLATIYLSAPSLVVLRARAVELVSYLTRAAIEDNPLLEPLITRTQGWTEQLITAVDFDALSLVLMDALEDFIDGVYIHGINRSNTSVSKALDFIGRHFTTKISLARVANEVGLSRYRLSHLVKQHTGRTVLQIIQESRVRHAQHLLERTDMRCSEIAYEVGFGDQSYFTKHFKRLTGTTPERYRRHRS